jgi:hypothetical protein
MSMPFFNVYVEDGGREARTFTWCPASVPSGKLRRAYFTI